MPRTPRAGRARCRSEDLAKAHGPTEVEPVQDGPRINDQVHARGHHSPALTAAQELVAQVKVEGSAAIHPTFWLARSKVRNLSRVVRPAGIEPAALRSGVLRISVPTFSLEFTECRCVLPGVDISRPNAVRRYPRRYHYSWAPRGQNAALCRAGIGWSYAGAAPDLQHQAGRDG